MSERVRALLRRKQVETEMDEEIRFHLEMAVRKEIDRGTAPAEARRRAHQKLGGVEQVKERTRDERGVRLLEDLGADLRYGCRRLAASPGFTLIAVLSLALGIGANTAVFSQLEAVLLRQLPVKEPHRLALFNWDAPPDFQYGSQTGWMDQTDEGLSTSTSYPYPMFERFQAQLGDHFEDIFAFFPLWGGISLNAGGEAELASAQLVSGNYFSSLGVGAAIGRTIGPDDDRPGAPPVAVISHGYWQRRFGGNPAIVGRQVNLNGQLFTLIGVTRKGFEGTLQVGDSPEVTLPLSLEAQVQRRSPSRDLTDRWWLLIMGRLRDGVSMEQAETAAAALLRRSVAADRGLEAGSDDTLPMARLTTGSRGLNDIRSRLAEPLLALLGVVGLVLVIACANVAGLLLARGATLRREVAIRLSIGAGRGRIVRQLLTESLLLALSGGAVGLLLAFWGRDLVAVIVARSSAFSVDAGARIDGSVLLFTMGLCLLSTIVFGLVPALRASVVNFNSALKEERGSSSGPARLVLGRSLVTVQVALSVTTLVVAGLFAGTFLAVRQQDPGIFNADNVALFKVDPSLNGYTPEREKALVREALARLRALPGARDAAAAQYTPLGQVGSRRTIAVPGRPEDAPRISVDYNFVQAGFFELLEIPLLAGRGFSDADSLESQPVAVINEAMKREFFPDVNPVGSRFGFGSASSAQIEIVGVAADVNYRQIRSNTGPAFYLHLPQRQTLLGTITFLTRSDGDSGGRTDMIRKLFLELDPDLPLFGFTTLAAQVEAATAPEKQFAQLSLFFAGIALGLSCIGLYGLLSYSVNRRFHEFGIRAALGARRPVLVVLVLKESLFVLAGLGLGVVTALGATRLISGMLFGLSPTDIAPYAAACAVLLIVALAASYLPARRAGRVDPALALRTE